MPRQAIRKQPKPSAVKAAATRTASKTTTKKQTRVPIEEEIDETPVVAEIQPKKARKTPTPESVLLDFDDLVESINIEIQNLRDGPSKTKGIKFLRSLNKRIKTLRGQTGRVMKQKKKTGRSNNKNSGFLKPVPISAEMAKFTGWDPSQLRSRVEVTKFICDYISEHDLQNPEDRRQIKPDTKLQRLLGYNPKKEREPLKYYSLQTHLKKHFT